MADEALHTFEQAMPAGDAATLCAAVARLEGDALAEARKLAERLADPAVAAEVIRAIDDRADELGIALSA